MIRLEVPTLPPSANHAYFNLPGGRGRGLTKKGKAYKAETVAYITRTYPEEMLFFNPKDAYLLLVCFHFKALYNKGYPKTAKTKYKKIDLGNRLKLFEDALKDAAGIDDCQNMIIVMQKLQGDEEKTTFAMWNICKETTPFDEAIRPFGVQQHRAVSNL